MKYRACVALAAGLLFVSHQTSEGTILTFDIQGIANGQYIPQAYGDRVDAAVIGQYSYGIDNGVTPNVVVSYLGLGTQTELNWWGPEYSDLYGIVEYEKDGAPGFHIRLDADPGFAVRLESLDLGNWDPGYNTLPALIIKNAVGTPLFTQQNILLDPVLHDHLDFAPPIIDSTLIIEVSTVGMIGAPDATDEIGLDNIAFSQIVVPEPGASALLSLGALSVVRNRRSRN